MKTTIPLLAVTAALVLCSCSSKPKPVDPFDAAINANLGAMVGGIMGQDAGGAL